MSVHHNRKSTGLDYYLDANNKVSYIGSGAEVKNIVNPTETSTLTNGVGFENGAFTFDGVDDYVNNDSCRVSLDATAVGTVGAWIKPNAIGSSQTFLSFADTSEVLFMQFSNFSGKFRARVFGGASDEWALDTTAIELAVGRWDFLAVVQDGVSPIVYVNGVAVAQSFTVQSNKTLWHASAEMAGLDNGRLGLIHYNGGSDVSLFNGSIGEVLFHDKVLTASDLLDFYIATKNKHE